MYLDADIGENRKLASTQARNTKTKTKFKKTARLSAASTNESKRKKLGKGRSKNKYIHEIFLGLQINIKSRMELQVDIHLLSEMYTEARGLVVKYP